MCKVRRCIIKIIQIVNVLTLFRCAAKMAIQNAAFSSQSLDIANVRHTGIRRYSHRIDNVIQSFCFFAPYLYCVEVHRIFIVVFIILLLIFVDF